MKKLSTSVRAVISQFIAVFFKPSPAHPGNLKPVPGSCKYCNRDELLIRRGKKINMVLVLWFLKMRARVREIFFLFRAFYQLANVDLVLKGRVGEKFETQFNYFIATSY